MESSLPCDSQAVLLKGEAGCSSGSSAPAPEKMGTKSPQPFPFSKGAVVAIILVGFLVRFVGLRWSLPNLYHPFATYHPDELIDLQAALQADIPHFKFDIGFYNYGTFYFYLVSLAQTVAAGYHLLPALQTPSAAHQASLFLVGRVVTALLGGFTVPVVYALGKRLYGEPVGLAAAFLYALAPLAVVYSHFLAVDVPATFFVSLALLGSARLLEKETLKDCLLAGVWVGLATATKYTAGVCFIAPLTALWLRKGSWKGMGSMALAAVGAFFVGCPGPILNWNVFWNGLPGYPGSGVRYELFIHSRQGHGLLFVDTGLGWWYHLVVSLSWGLGLPFYGASLLGIGVALKRRTPADWLLLAFTLLYFSLIGFSAVRFARYTLPLFPALAVLSARGLATTAHMAKNSKAVSALLIGGVVGLTGVTSLGWLLCLVRPTPQDLAAAYLRKHLPYGGSVAFATIPWFYSPPLSPLFGLPAAPQRAQAATKSSRFSLRLPPHEWDTEVLSPPPDAVVLSNFETMHPLRLGLPATRRFLQAIPSFYGKVVFGRGVPWGAPPWRTIVPDDFLYICPTLTLYLSPQVLGRKP